ncbi:SUKH-4 family immunity protein [Streptomyces sp. NPDC054756]
MHAPLGPQETVDQLRARLDHLKPTHGFVYLDGPSGAGKSRLLQEFADATPGAVLIDAAGCTAEQVADRVVRAIGVPHDNDQRSLFDLYLIAQEQDLSHVVILTNTQWAGTTRHTDEPWNVAIGGIVAQFGIKSGRVGVKFIVEVDTEVHELRPRSRPVVLAPDHGTSRWSPDSLSSRERAALSALALSERHHVRFDEWQTLCSMLGADLDEAELRTIATESPLVTVDPSAHRPVGFTHERDARTLRRDIPADAYRAFQYAITDRLFACTDDDPLDSYLAHSLPAHAAAADRFEELLEDPRLVAKCTRATLLSALRLAFPHRIPAGSQAADLYYLANLELAPSSQDEWVSLLHLVALCQGDTERADALAEAAGPLPWRTVWTHWRAPGRVRPCPPQIDGVTALRATPDGSTVTSSTRDGHEQTWDAATGRLLSRTAELTGAEGSAVAEATPTSPAPARWEAETSWNLVRVSAVGNPSTHRVIQAPKADEVACAGNLIVIGGSRGIYAIEPNPDYVEDSPLPALPVVTWYTEVTPRPYHEAACRPTRDLVLDVFDGDIAPLLTEDKLPAGLTHQPTRRFLTETGFPAISNFLSLNTHNLAGTGFIEHTWEGTKDFETRVGDGPFYELGTWIGGVLLLDGPTGRVLRQSRKNAVDGDRPGDPLAGTSLAQFTAMVCLQWKYMMAYVTDGGLDGDDLIEELKAWLAGIDPAAAATRNWGHVTETEEFYYLY